MCIVIHIFHKTSPFLNNYLILSTDSIIPWIALPNKCSFLFFTIHLPPVEEGEILAIYYIILNNQRLLTLSAAFDTQSQCVSEYIEFHSYLIQVFLRKVAMKTLRDATSFSEDLPHICCVI